MSFYLSFPNCYHFVFDISHFFSIGRQTDRQILMIFILLLSHLRGSVDMIPIILNTPVYGFLPNQDSLHISTMCATNP